MIPKYLLDRLSTDFSIENKIMLEKDMIIHKILTDLSNNEYFSENYIFKGGTCLAKNYLDYFRFSEDIDFTLIDQSIFDGKSRKQVRETLSDIVGKVGKIIEESASKNKLDFKFIKTDIHYVMIGSSGRLCTFKIWFEPTSLSEKAFIKVQLNFFEKLYMNPKKGKLRSLVTKNDQRLEFFPDYLEYLNTIPLYVYDIREILSEKIRAVLTRKRFAIRDFYDIFMIQKILNKNPKSVEKYAIEKINYSIKRYAKYRDNLRDKREIFESNTIKLGTEQTLLISKIDENEFKKFTQEFGSYVRNLMPKLDMPKE